MRRYIGYAFITVALLTLIVWAISQFVQPILPANINSGLVLFFVALLGVTGLLAQLKDTVEFFQHLFEKPSQAEKSQSVGSLLTGPIHIFHGNVTNVTLNVTYLIQSSSFDSIKAITIQPDSGMRARSLVPREAPIIPSHIVGRTNELATLKKILLKQSQTLALVSLSGLGGIGKTTLAAMVANDPDVERAFPDGTLWAYIRNGDFREILVRWIRALGLSTNENEMRDIDEWTLLTVFLHAARNRRMLIVFDDVDGNSIRYIQPLIRAIGLESKVLLTSRIVNLPDVETILSLDVLPEQESVSLIEREIGRKLDRDEQSVAREIAFLSGYLPLALKFSAGLMKHTGMSLTQLRDNLRARISYKGIVGLDDVRENLMTFIFGSVFGELSPDEQVNFRALIALQEPFDSKTVANVWGTDVSETENTLRHFVQLALLNVNDGVYSMHPLTRAFAQERLPNSGIGKPAQ